MCVDGDKTLLLRRLFCSRLMQNWLFVNAAWFWKTPQIKALVTSVPLVSWVARNFGVSKCCIGQVPVQFMAFHSCFRSREDFSFSTWTLQPGRNTYEPTITTASHSSGACWAIAVALSVFTAGWTSSTRYFSIVVTRLLCDLFLRDCFAMKLHKFCLCLLLGVGT